VIVVDTNVIAYFWIPGKKTEQAEALMLRDPQWIAPVLWRSELQNILAGCLRRGDLSLPQIQDILDSSEAFFVGKEFFVASQIVMKLASESECTAYDCEFVGLAVQKRIQLVTNDKAILKNFPHVAVRFDDYSGAGA
jgi:predicted nucleic acid-binding protein